MALDEKPSPSTRAADRAFWAAKSPSDPTHPCFRSF